MITWRPRTPSPQQPSTHNHFEKITNPCAERSCLKLAIHWLRVSAIIAEFKMGCYGYTLTRCVSALLIAAHVKFSNDSAHASSALDRHLASLWMARQRCSADDSAIFHHQRAISIGGAGVSAGAFHDRSTSETPILHPSNFDFAQKFSIGFYCALCPYPQSNSTPTPG